jgi:hypothetical protein
MHHLYHLIFSRLIIIVCHLPHIRSAGRPQKLRALLATDLPAHVWTGDAAATCVRIVPIFALTFRRMAEVLAEAKTLYAYAWTLLYFLFLVLLFACD